MPTLKIWDGVAWRNIGVAAPVSHELLPNLDYAHAGHTGFEPAITAGTSSQVLLGDKTLANSNAVGGMTLVSTASPSAAANFTISGLSPAIQYAIFMDTIQNTSTGSPVITFNGDTGANYINAAMGHASTTTLFGSVATGQSSIPTGWNTKATYPLKLEAFFRTIQGNNNTVAITIHMFTYSNSQSAYLQSRYDGIYSGANPLSSITFTDSAGTMTGTASLYKLN